MLHFTKEKHSISKNLTYPIVPVSNFAYLLTWHDAVDAVVGDE